MVPLLAGTGFFRGDADFGKIGLAQGFDWISAILAVGQFGTSDSIGQFGSRYEWRLRVEPANIRLTPYHLKTYPAFPDTQMCLGIAVAYD
jgi:hypothetical protein